MKTKYYALDPNDLSLGIVYKVENGQTYFLYPWDKQEWIICSNTLKSIMHHHKEVPEEDVFLYLL